MALYSTYYVSGRNKGFSHSNSAVWIMSGREGWLMGKQDDEENE